MQVRYHYDEIITDTVREFCATALVGETLPESIKYDIESEYMSDAFRENVYCVIGTDHGRVNLSFGIFQWCGERMALAPEVVDLAATRVMYDGFRFSWDIREKRWVEADE